MSYRGSMTFFRLTRMCLAVGLLGVGLFGSGCQRLTELTTPSTPNPNVPPALRGPRVYITDGSKGVYAVACAEGEIAEQFPAPGGAGDVDVSADGRTLYATISKSDQVMFYETSGHPVGRCAVGTDPQALVLVNKGREALVANRGSRDVSVVDLAKRQVLRRIPIWEAPFDLVSSFDDRRFWVSLHDANAVAQFDAATGKETARIPVGLHPYHLARDPMGVYLYVTIYDENVIAVVDMRAGQIVARVRTGEGPYAVVASKAGGVYVANLEAGTVTFFMREKWDDTRELRVGPRPTSMALSPDEKSVFVTMESDAHLMVLTADPSPPLATMTRRDAGGPRGVPSASPSPAPPPVVEEGATRAIALPFAPTHVFCGGKV